MIRFLAVRRYQVLAPAASLVLGLAAASVAVGGQEQSAIYLFALDQKDTPVLDLQPPDITIKEDVGSSSIVSVRRFGWPLKVTVLVDNGPRTIDALVQLNHPGAKIVVSTDGSIP